MSRSGPSRGVVLTVIGLGIFAAAAAAVCGVVLADGYRTHGPGELHLLPEAVRRSDRWSDWHRLTSAASLVAAGTAVPLLLWIFRRAGRMVRREVVAVAASATGLIMAILTVATRPLVEWDQLGLRSVTVGTDLSGYWTAGFGDDVLFILTNGSEVSQGQYVAALLPHLAAPFVGAAALVVAAIAVARPDPRPPDRVRPGSATTERQT